MQLTQSEVKDDIRIIIIDVQRLVDETIISQCYREIVELLDKSVEKHVLLHFGRVAFMASAALGSLVRLNKKCKEYEVSLKLSNISPEIFEVFKITGMTKVFSIHKDASEAMAAFKAGGGLFFRKYKETRQNLT
jgi:anti-anti-sigma factor